MVNFLPSVKLGVALSNYDNHKEECVMATLHEKIVSSIAVALMTVVGTGYAAQDAEVVRQAENFRDLQAAYVSPNLAYYEKLQKLEANLQNLVASHQGAEKEDESFKPKIEPVIFSCVFIFYFALQKLLLANKLGERGDALRVFNIGHKGYCSNAEH